MEVLSLLSLLGAAALATASAQDASPVRPEAGDPAPEFALPGSDGRTYRLSELRGRTVVLAWFPKAFTGG